MIQGIIFDIGGVLAYDVWEHLFFDDDGVRAKFPQLDAETVSLWGKRTWDEYAFLPESPRCDWRALEQNYWGAFIQRFRKQLPVSASPDEFIALSQRFFRPVQGMNMLLEKVLAQDFTLGICSDNNEFWFRRQAQAVGFDKFFDSDKIILSCRVGASKYSAQFEMFEAVTRAIGVPKQLCVLVDDRGKCLERAAEFGLTGILYPAESAFGAQYVKALLRKLNTTRRET